MPGRCPLVRGTASSEGNGGEELSGGHRTGKASPLNTHPFLAPRNGWGTSAKAPFSRKPGCQNFSPPRALLFLAAIHYVKEAGYL